MPKRNDLNKVMVIGSGPIVIGQAAEFDYAGTQACKALREEGLEVVLVNSNPATIMTDTKVADHVYIEPLNSKFLEQIISQEKPDGLLPTLGGQMGLNLAIKLSNEGIFEKYNIEILGTSLNGIKKAEDREEFRNTMNSICEPIPASAIIEDINDGIKAAKQLGYPLIVRPAYTLGGTGGGIANNEGQLIEVISKGLNLSMINQVLLEQCVLGWKEIEYEVMRDGADNCITICNMENIDPMGVHTGDSIVVAPSQTLSDKEYQMLRSASLNVIRSLGIEGGCNVQMALDPHSMRYYIIEVNPRVSRSSALASKATGYPIARVAAKIAIGLRLDEIPNAVTQKTMASFEPALDYLVVKIPRFPFDKMPEADNTIGTQMKATGEVMAIDRSFESALLKAIRSLEYGVSGLHLKKMDEVSDMQLENLLHVPNDERLFAIAEALRRGLTVREIHEVSSIDAWFIEKIRNIVNIEERISSSTEIDWDLLKQAKVIGFSDKYIAEIKNCSEKDICSLRKSNKEHKLSLQPVYKMVDTCAAEFEAATPYFYSTYQRENESIRSDNKRVLVIGSGPIRIGQGIEFDYCSVHAVLALKEEGYEAIIVNNNPETVSTDFDTSDKLYFEPLTYEDIMNVIELEKPYGVIVQFGGQTPINLAEKLSESGVPILGTSYESIDRAEDRKLFDQLLVQLSIPKPQGKAVITTEEAAIVAGEIGYPVIVRPSYVLGGRAMDILYNEKDLLTYLSYVVKVAPDRPILIEKYVQGKEAEVDAICDVSGCLLPGIMEHIERAGVHSGDSIAVCPPQTLSDKVIEQIVDYTTRLAKSLKIVGLMNIQYVVDQNDKVFVLEVNPRASRTVPYLSKLTGIPIVDLATKLMLGRSLKDYGYKHGLYPPPNHVAVKAPVFSFAKLLDAEIELGPEMKSTGEIMGIDFDFPRALYKAMVSSGFDLPVSGSLLATIADRNKDEALSVLSGFEKLGFKIYATDGTAKFLLKNDIQAETVPKIERPHPNILDFIKNRTCDLVINTPTGRRGSQRDGLMIRRASVEHNIPCITSLDTAEALLTALQTRKASESFSCLTIDQYAIYAKSLN